MGEVNSPRNPAVPFHLHFWEFRSIFPFHGNGDFDVSPCWEENKGQKCLRKGGQKSLEIMPSPSSMAWSFLCVPFPLCSPEWKVDFCSSFSLPRLHPALGSWQCQHSHPGITVKIASFFFDNKIQQPKLKQPGSLSACLNRCDTNSGPPLHEFLVHRQINLYLFKPWYHVVLYSLQLNIILTDTKELYLLRACAKPFTKIILLIWGGRWSS